MEPIPGMTEESIPESGKITNYMGREHLFGQTEEDILGHMSMIKRKEKVYLHVQMERSTPEVGFRENNPGKEYIKG